MFEDTAVRPSFFLRILLLAVLLSVHLLVRGYCCLTMQLLDCPAFRPSCRSPVLAFEYRITILFSYSIIILFDSLTVRLFYCPIVQLLFCSTVRLPPPVLAYFTTPTPTTSVLNGFDSWHGTSTTPCLAVKRPQILPS
jgi:hypothetical protein